ncbi:MAG TPA: M23 family metallopeptidase [Actinomycetota bacterium]|nr:M23 family metallopeptidase [Actinomycetota bacterium]
MRGASQIAARWAFAAATVLVTGAALTAPAIAQTPPQPAPAPTDGLGGLLNNLLQPVAPILNPQPAQPAPNPGGSTSGGTAPSGTTAKAATASNIPKTSVESPCGPAPRPLVFNRTPGRTSQNLVNAAVKDAPPGVPVQQELVAIAAPFPVAGSAHYQDDWGNYRSTPCPHLHQGNDIFAPMGAPAVAPEDGTVVRFDYESVGGNAYYFAGADGYSFYGAHLEGFAPGLKAGEHVTAGTVLGYVGNTGDAAGGATHLHFQLYPPGHAWSNPVDPKFWLDASLNTAIGKAGGVVGPDDTAAQIAAAPIQPPLSAQSLMGSVLLAGGHIITQPTVPVLLFVLLVLGVIGISQTRTLRVARDLRASRTEAEVPVFLVGGTAGLVAAQAPPKRRRKGAGAVTNGVPVDHGLGQPSWAVSKSVANSESRTASPVSRRIERIGEAWERFPTTMSRLGTRADSASTSKRDSVGGDAGSSRAWSATNGTSTPVIDRAGEKSAKAFWTPGGSAATSDSKRSGSRFASR